MFGQLVVMHRRRLALTQEQLAEKTRLSVRSLRDLEAGRVLRPRLSSVRLLADAFDLQGAERERFCRLPYESTGVHDAADPVSAAAVPAQLPADVAGFTGRHAELTILDASLAAETPTAVVITAIAGTAGVGKTALAVHWAHRVRDRFPDGQLYVNLRGYDPDEPVTAEAALAGFLGALGVPAERLPLGVAERSARFRTEVAGRRILVVLDNASSVTQVRPLLPGTASAAVVVTSRDSLAGLVVRDGAQRLELDMLPVDEAVALLRRLVGARVDAEPEAAVTLTEQCARLPLALRVAAELAATRRTTALADLVAELADRRRRLDLLAAGDDPHAAVRGVFSWSVRNLPADAARAFALLGLHPGPDFDVYALAALTGAGLDDARTAVALLARAHLVHHVRQTPRGERYGMHDLMRAYAADLAHEDGAGPTAQAQERLVGYYLATTAAAMNGLHPAEAHYRPSVDAPRSPAPDLTHPDAARAWLDAERPILVGLTTHAARHGSPRTATRMSSLLFRYLDAGHHADALSVHGHAWDAAVELGDLRAQATAQLGLGGARYRLGHGEPAAEHFSRAISLAEQADDPLVQGRALANLGHVNDMWGRYGKASECHTLAVALHRQAGDPNGEANALAGLGAVENLLGRHDAANDHLQRSITLFRQLGNRVGEAYALANLGSVEHSAGRFHEAIERHTEALVLFRELGNHTGEAWALNDLGTHLTRSHRHDEATEHHEQALALFRRTGEREGQSSALNGLGEAAHAAGDHARAVAHHQAALVTADELGLGDQQARAHAGIGHAHLAAGERASARDHYERALAVFEHMGAPEAEQLRAHLAAVDENGRHEPPR